MLSQFQAYFAVLFANMPMILAMIGGLWLIHIFNVMLGHRLNLLGIYPRHIIGLFGIPFSPFLHGDFGHLFVNTIPLFILACFVSLGGWKIFYCVSIVIILLGGFGIWLVGRPGIHIGASALVMGYWSYLLVNAYEYGTMLSIILALVCLYYFGTFILNLFPTQSRSSWEGHICGFVAGIVASFVCQYL